MRTCCISVASSGRHGPAHRARLSAVFWTRTASQGTRHEYSLPAMSRMASLLVCAAAAPAASFLLGAGPTASRVPTHRVPALVAKEGGVDALKAKLARVTTVGLYGALLVVSGSDLLEKVPTGLTGGQIGDIVLDGGLFVVAGLQLTVPPERALLRLQRLVLRRREP